MLVDLILARGESGVAGEILPPAPPFNKLELLCAMPFDDPLNIDLELLMW